MQINEAALTEFIKLYKDEFDENIDRDEARIIARNLVMLYLDLDQAGIFQATSRLQDEVPSERPAND